MRIDILPHMTVAVLIGGIAFVVGLGYLGHEIASMRQSGIVTVRGAAEMPVEADLATWRLMVTTSGNDLNQTQAEFARNIASIRTFLTQQGLPDTDIENLSVQVADAQANQYREYRAGEGAPARFAITGGVLVRTSDLKAIQTAKNEQGKLLAGGVVITSSDGPNYAFSSLSDAKPDLVANATKEARKAAIQFASVNGLSLKKMVSARQGSVEILGRDAFLGEAEQIHKTLRVVTTVDYQVE